MSNEETYRVPVPYMIAREVIDYKAISCDRPELKDKIGFEWAGRRTIKGRPPVVELTADEIEVLAIAAEDLAGFSDLFPGERNTAVKFYQKYRQWKKDGTPFTGHSKGKGGNARDKFPKEFVSEVESLVHQYVKEFQHIALDEIGAAPDYHNVTIKFRYDGNTHRSRGGQKRGRSWMSIAVGEFLSYWREDRPFVFGEYDSFKKDRMIGTAECKDWRMGLKVLVAHEYAHVVQHDPQWTKYPDWIRKLDKTGHKARFKTIYGIFRNSVNQEIGGRVGQDYYDFKEQCRQKAENKFKDMAQNLQQIAASSK